MMFPVTDTTYTHKKCFNCQVGSLLNSFSGQPPKGWIAVRSLPEKFSHHQLYFCSQECADIYEVTTSAKLALLQIPD